MSEAPEYPIGTLREAAAHPTEYLAEEMEARGWDKFDLVSRMGGDPARNLLMVDMYFIVGPLRTNCRMGDVMGHQLAVALDVSPQFLFNLERAWLDAQRIEARSAETPQEVRPEGREPDPEGGAPQ